MRTNYVLIDFENVRPEGLDRLADDRFRLLMFVGAGQSKLPFELAASLQQLGPRAQYVKIAGSGPNALDFHIAYAIGRLAAADPVGSFHVISKDKGFDPLIRHLRSEKILACRVEAIAQIPLLRASNATTTTTAAAERLKVALARLRQLNGARPKTVKALSNAIATQFGNKLSKDEVAAVVRDLARGGFLAIEGSDVRYAPPIGG